MLLVLVPSPQAWGNRICNISRDVTGSGSRRSVWGERAVPPLPAGLEGGGGGDPGVTGLWLLSPPQKHIPLPTQERLQNLWVVYQRLGLEDDIVDPSNELIKEGPIQKISTRNNSTSEKYLFLVGAGLLWAREQMRWERGEGSTAWLGRCWVTSTQRG